MTEPTPALRLLSLGAGVQSTTICLLMWRGTLPPVDGAVFADTGWEPEAVYAHLERLEAEVLEPMGIPLYRVSNGDIREDTMAADRRYVALPLFIRNADGSQGIGRRQCTEEYKLKPIRRKHRELLGYPHPKRVPRDVWVETWIGISTDEFTRAKDSTVKYERHRFPLIELDLTRRDCLRILHAEGYPDTPKSACIGCPFHGNRYWRTMRDNRPDEWASAVQFDAALRDGPAAARLKGGQYLHRSMQPLDQAPLDKPSRADKRAAQLDLVELLKDQQAGVDVDGWDDEAGAEQGCGPWSCRSDGR